MKYKKTLVVAVIFGLLLAFTSSWWVKKTRALATTWNQTDWSGGTASGTVTGTVTTYSSTSSVTTSSAGQVTLGETAGWFNSSWLYRQPINLSNSGSTLTDYQIMVNFNTQQMIADGKLQADCDDLRFANSSGQTLYFALDPDATCGSASTSYWVKVDSIVNGSSSIYVYYGNAAASSSLDPDNTFEFFDEFTGGALDGNKWTVNAVGTIPHTVSGGLLNFTANPSLFWTYDTNTVVPQHRAKYGITDNVSIQWRSSYAMTSALDDGQFGMGFTDIDGKARSYIYRGDSNANNYNPFILENPGSNATSTAVSSTSTNRHRLTRVGTTSKAYTDNTLKTTGTIPGTPTHISIWATYLGYWFHGATFSWVFTHKEAATPPSISSYGTEETSTATSGYLISNIFDAELPSNWGTFSFTTSGGTTEVRVRTGNVSNMSDAIDFASCDAISSGADISANNCVDDGDQYIQYKVSLATSSGVGPTFQDVTLLYQASDSTAPTANASTVTISGFSSGGWLTTAPTISWTAGTDAETGILGYCIALEEVVVSGGVPSSLDPVSNGGVLNDLTDAQSFSPSRCKYIVTGTSVNLGSITGLTLTSGKRYYFSIKAIDQAGNVWSGTASTYSDLINFKFDNTAPAAPSYLSVPGSFVSTKDVTVTWPTTGSAAASDQDSGLAGLQYRIGANGTWYGVNRSGAQDLTDLLSNSGSYTTNPIVDYPLLQQGSNVFYIRALDNAGNPSSQYTSGAIKINTTAPSEPTNVTVTPSDNTSNSYAFDWDPPTTYSGNVDGLTYCYTINTLPTANTCTFTTAGTTALSASAYATQPGANRFYVVAKDEAGNMSYEAYQSVAFTYSGTAPGIPLNVDVSDISIKANSSWKLAISWAAPTNVGAGVSAYKVFRTTTATTCSDSFSSFTEIGQVGGTATVYSDSGLSQQTYYYCVKACDSANNCGAVSSTDSGYPDGKYTEAATLTSGPTVSGVTSRQATVTWSTNRNSDSRIQYGTTSDDYFDEEIGNSTQVTDHSVKLENLFAGTTYYYRTTWVDEDGNLGRSDEKSFSTTPPPTVTDPKPKTLGLEEAVIQFTVKGAKKVRIYYGKNTSFGNVTEIQTSLNESTYTVQLEKLEDGTTYYYKINPINDDDIEYDTSILTFATIARPKISKITIQQVPNTSQSTLLIAWETNTATSSIVSYYPSKTPAKVQEEVKTIFRVGEHKMVITGFEPQTEYTLVIKGVDTLGNEAFSSPQIVTTATDTRPPTISDVTIETSTLLASGTENSENLSQLIVTWVTDELSTSQVEFGEGINGQYGQKSTKDDNLTYNHSIIINGLSNSKVFHLRAISKDIVGNTGYSGDLVAITNRPSDQAIDLVVQNLGDVFSFLNRGNNE